MEACSGWENLQCRPSRDTGANHSLVTEGCGLVNTLENYMGTPHPNSPNGCWLRHGYRIERVGKYGCKRNIYAPDGTLVLSDAGYDEQMAYCREHGLLLPEAELEKVM